MEGQVSGKSTARSPLAAFAEELEAVKERAAHISSMVQGRVDEILGQQPEVALKKEQTCPSSGLLPQTLESKCVISESLEEILQNINRL